jgi:uncharacterized protein involved in outer membrane biogenesis
VNNLLIAIAVFIITVLGALFAVPHFIDWNSYRSNFEEEAKNVIGREVQVDGDVKLHLLPTPYFRIEKVRIADSSTSLTEHFFKAESLSIKLSIAPLLRGVVEVNEIEFQRPVLRVAQDAKGAWNWQDFAQALGSTGYVPANVTLASVRVVDGVLALHGTDGVERTRLDGVNGELSAPALDGPYRFRGSFTSGGAGREVRIGTASPEADGKVPLRLTLRLLDTGASYVFDVRAIDLLGKARVEGDLTARLPIAGPVPAGTQRASAGSDEEASIDRGETPLEVKAKIKADVAGAAFSDLTLTFELGDRPQIVTGTARAAWRAPVTLDMDLSSRWLDLDRLAGAAEGVAPAASVTKLAAWVRDLLPGEGLARMGLSIEQANLAGEVIGPLRLALARSANSLEIGELRTTLPGGTRVDLKGNISGAAEALAYRGDIGVKGASTARFVAWATGNALNIAADADGPLELRANIAVDPVGGVAVRDFTGTLAGTALKGSGGYKWRDRPELTVALEGPKLDARSLLPADMSLLDLYGLLAPAAKSSAGRTEMGKAMSRLFEADLDLRLKAGQLVTAARTYRDFSTAVVTKGDSIKQLNLRLAGDDGYNLDLEGRVDNLGGAAKGIVRGHAVAQTSDSIAPLATLLGIPAKFRPADTRQQAIAPLRLAGTLSLGTRTQTSADLVLDGEANGTPVKVTARFDGGAGGWRSGRADVTASMDSTDAGKIAAILFPGSAPPSRAGIAKPGRVLVRAAGIPSQGLVSVVSVDAADVALTYRGQVAIPDAGTKAEGELELRAGNGTALAALAGLPPALRIDGVPVSARMRLGLDDTTISMDKLALQVGGSRLSGKIALSESADGRRRIDANLATEEIAMSTLLSPLLDLRFGAAGAAEAVLLGRPIPWPDEPFSASAFDAFEGQVRLSAKRLKLTDGMAVEGAKLHVVLQPGKIDIKEIDGTALGGEVKAAISFEKAPAGAEVRGSFAIGLMLEELPGARPPRASGAMLGRVEFAGRGVSPRAVVSALQGEGSIAFDDAKLPGLAPGAVAAAAEAALKAEPGKLAPTLRQVLATGLATGSLPVGQASFGLEIADGLVRSRPLVIDAGEGRASGTARLDLKTLKLDSQWRLEAKPPGLDSKAKALPAVVVSYRAPIATLGAAELQIDTAVLEQELAARKIERDMEELDRLRKLNEADPLRKAPAPAAPAEGLPPGPAAPAIPPFGHEVRPGSPG